MSHWEKPALDLKELLEAPEDWVAEHAGGTYRTNWEFLRRASSSSYYQAVKEVSGIVEAWQKELQSDAPRGSAIVSAVLTMNYQRFASGPLLSCCLFPVLSIEAFCRLVAEVALRDQTTSARSLTLALEGFDRGQFRTRVDIAIDLSGGAALPRHLVRRLKNLVEFRNAVSHDLPTLITPDGVLLQAKRGKVRLVEPEEAFAGEYPVLHDSMMPLELHHAHQAIAVHDDLVEHILSTAAADFANVVGSSLAPSYDATFTIRGMGGDIWGYGQELADFWRNRVLTWDAEITREERADMLRDVLRRQTVKPVSDG